MVKVGLVGVSGYSGFTALKILLKHPSVRLTYVSANNTQGKLTDIWPQLKGQTNLVCDKYDFGKMSELCDVVFLAVPHTVSMSITPKLLESKKIVIDLSGDYRLKKTGEYEKWYGTPHVDESNLAKAVYGLPELYREDIKKAKLISNPGCYPTAALIGLSPVLSTHSGDITSIVIDAKSGVTGAGRKSSTNLLFAEVNENLKAYKVLKHQHAPEINLYLSKVANKQISVNFVPHLLPVNVGILETIYIHFSSKQKLADIYKIYERFYKTEPFVRLYELGAQPELKNVAATNYCDLGLAMNEEENLLVVTAAIDNLMKGAASQAVQNMNIICGFKEETALL
jgi:N-acetyl-gamma-glutamyl-phosphate reductase